MLRNPDFQEEFNELLRVVPELPFTEQVSKIVRFDQKWDVPFLIRHQRLFQGRDSLILSNKTVKDFEKELLKDTRSGRLLKNLIRSCTKKARIALRRQGYKLGRQHLEKVDFHLQVYDLRQKGKSFTAIAEATGKKLSTVKMAYRTAVRMILGSLETQIKRHYQNCARCQSGKTCRHLDSLIDLPSVGVSKGSRLVPVDGAVEDYRKRKAGNTHKQRLPVSY